MDVCYYLVAVEIDNLAKHAESFELILRTIKQTKTERKSLPSADKESPVKEEQNTNFKNVLTVFLCKYFIKIKIDQYYYDASKSWTDTNRSTKYPSNIIRESLLKMIEMNLDRVCKVQDKQFTDTQFTCILSMNILHYLLVIEEDHGHALEDIKKDILKIQYDAIHPWLKNWDAVIMHKNGRVPHSDAAKPFKPATAPLLAGSPAPASGRPVSALTKAPVVASLTKQVAGSEKNSKATELDAGAVAEAVTETGAETMTETVTEALAETARTKETEASGSAKSIRGRKFQ